MLCHLTRLPPLSMMGNDVAGWMQEQHGVRLSPSSVNPFLGDAGYYSGGAGLYLATSRRF
jgi:hypothetical protein